MISKPAQAFIAVVEAMRNWPEKTTLINCAGQTMTIKQARELAEELKEKPHEPT